MRISERQFSNLLQAVINQNTYNYSTSLASQSFAITSNAAITLGSYCTCVYAAFRGIYTLLLMAIFAYI